VSDNPPAFECMIYDAHCPSMTARFKVPEGFPLAGGIYRIERVRTVTEEDKASFARFPDPPDDCVRDEALEDAKAVLTEIVDGGFNCSPHQYYMAAQGRAERCLERIEKALA
jgi:hypothetical protein